MKKKTSAFKKLNQLLVMTSKTLLDTFLSDAGEQRLEKRTTKEIHDKLQQAAIHKSLVVLQLKTEKVDRFETIAGKVVGNNVGKDQVVLKMQSDQQQLRIIPIEKIEKISTLTPEGESDKLIR